MPYLALKPCKFDRAYIIGEVIPDDVVDPKREHDLIDEQRLIAKIGQSQPFLVPSDVNTPLSSQKAAGGENLTPGEDDNKGLNTGKTEDENGNPGDDNPNIDGNVPPNGDETPDDPPAGANDGDQNPDDGGSGEGSGNPNSNEGGENNDNTPPEESGSKEETQNIETGNLEPGNGDDTQEPGAGTEDSNPGAEKPTQEQQTAEGGNNTPVTDEPPKGEPLKLTTAKLSKMNKAELIALAKEWKLPVDEEMTKKQLIDVIIAVQGGEGE